MSNSLGKFKTDSHELENLISKAVKKIGAKKENDICRYLPIGSGGYIHHFTMRKMKGENPDALASMIKKYILDASDPKSVPPKSRAPRGSRKRRDQFLFTKSDIERMLNMARLAGDKEMIRKLTPRKDLKTVRRELLSTVRRGQVDHELWNSYVEAVTAQSNAAQHQEALA
jgi:hypothetical protein